MRSQGRRGLVVPLDAVLDAGTSKVVFVALGEGKFEPRTVTTGITVGERVEVLSGLKPGESVVVRANFLVDSESRLKAALAQLTHQH
jgi:Cu(I)/Ag(I) efflux system membrane fusion protein